MAITFPIASTVFAETLRVRSVAWRLEEYVITSGIASGALVTSAIAAPKWAAEIALAASAGDDARKVRAMLRRIGPHNAFYLHNPAAPFPRMDPGGTILGASTVTIGAISGRQITLTGLPASYALKWGDMLSVTYGASPERTALFEVDEDITANGSGVTGFFEVTPAPKAGMAAGNAVRLKKPVAKMRLVDFDPGSDEPAVANGITFRALETF